ncbi:flagellar biosynthesis protein FlhF [Clostridium vincentii]|uniref:Flagellar biosynthesis protein FlhF n=1 Tax=Clostridium vincentii TaxID=52704 RepID=A0A2T0BJ86_9CLOT|nr:flagellar biosynthesis protein FlhF [Clostridium vincentii]PRR83965.1 Flagellar biosynthesis protein FlhF [Clostridium vincentii]
MIIKKYMANNINEALTRIRHELGKEAVIISQRKIRKPGIKGYFSEKLIEVTAAVENYSVGTSKKNVDVTQEDNFKSSLDNLKKIMNKEIESKKVPVLAKKEEVIPPIVNLSLESEVAQMKELLNKVLKNTEKEEVEEDELLTLIKELDIDTFFYDELKNRVGNEDIKGKLREIVKEDIKIIDGELKGNVVLVGPTGVGKTTTIAKLAGRLSLIDKKKVGLITVDTYRIGAVEQLKTYAEIMNIPFKVVITMKDMEEAVKSMENCDIVLIDTTGRSSKNAMQISELRAFVQKAKPDSVNLVISSTTKNKDIKTIVDGYKELDYESIIITKLDETTVYGSLYNIQKVAQKPIGYITIGQNVPDDIKVPSKEEVVRLVFGEETLC